MYSISDVFAALIEGLGIVYFVAAGIIFPICIFPILAIKHQIKKAAKYRLLASLLFAVAFAPSIYGFDLGVVTLPAVYVILLSLLGVLRFIAFVWSAFSIIVVTFLSFLILSLFSRWVHRRF